MSTAARALADYAVGLRFQDLPSEVVHQVERHLLDTIACAIGGYDSDANRILHEVIKRLGGPTESTVIGSGIRTSCINASLVNGAMIRFLDLNDFQTYVSHPSEVIPPILALAEALHSSGEDVITAIALGYELLGRITTAMGGPTLGQGGWNSDLKAGLVIPVVAGKLLKLSEEQIENAIGIAGSRCMVLNILDAPKEENTMAKNLRFPLTAYLGLLAAFMAQKGFTGPRRVMEGQNGFVEVVLKGNFDYDKLTKPADKFQIMYAGLKRFCACYSTHGHIQATLELVEEHDIKPTDISSIKLTLNTRTMDHTTDPIRRLPSNKETADHSSYYITAIAIMERMVGPEQYAPEKYQNADIRELIEKIVIDSDPRLDQFYPAAIVEIVTKNGKKFSRRVSYPRGHYTNPLTDKEIEKKFQFMASKYMSETQMQKIFNTIYGLEKLDDVTNLMQLLFFKI